jgi:prepilin-type N-terminal cleavage/methylation domain-containing protein
MINFSLSSIRSPRGFTLVETLVSTMIIAVVILGPLTVASNASTYARLTKDTLIATYLAQEAIELLRHQQDSVYLRCIQYVTSACPITGNEAPEESAWRIFKARLGGNAQGPSCFSNENPNGCSFDFIDMTSDQNNPPIKYTSTSSSCNTLSLNKTDKTYVCSGSRGSGSGYTPTGFNRSISILSLETFSEGATRYDDDLRVTVTITFKRPNGYQHQIKVVDFLHTKA